MLNMKIWLLSGSLVLALLPVNAFAVGQCSFFYPSASNEATAIRADGFRAFRKLVLEPTSVDVTMQDVTSLVVNVPDIEVMTGASPDESADAANRSFSINTDESVITASWLGSAPGPDITQSPTRTTGWTFTFERALSGVMRFDIGGAVFYGDRTTAPADTDKDLRIVMNFTCHDDS